MTQPPSPPSLATLRQEIDSIDEQVHRLLMQRGEIIDRLIAVKQTQEVGSAFRPAREADMMRRLVQRHRGILPTANGVRKCGGHVLLPGQGGQWRIRM